MIFPITLTQEYSSELIVARTNNIQLSLLTSLPFPILLISTFTSGRNTTTSVRIGLNNAFQILNIYSNTQSVQISSPRMTLLHISLHFSIHLFLVDNFVLSSPMFPCLYLRTHICNFSNSRLPCFCHSANTDCLQFSHVNTSTRVFAIFSIVGYLVFVICTIWIASGPVPFSSGGNVPSLSSTFFHTSAI